MQTEGELHLATFNRATFNHDDKTAAWSCGQKGSRRGATSNHDGRIAACSCRQKGSDGGHLTMTVKQQHGVADRKGAMGELH